MVECREQRAKGNLPQKFIIVKIMETRRLQYLAFSVKINNFFYPFAAPNGTGEQETATSRQVFQPPVGFVILRQPSPLRIPCQYSSVTIAAEPFPTPARWS